MEYFLHYKAAAGAAKVLSAAITHPIIIAITMSMFRCFIGDEPKTLQGKKGRGIHVMLREYIVQQ